MSRELAEEILQRVKREGIIHAFCVELCDLSYRQGLLSTPFPEQYKELFTLIHWQPELIILAYENVMHKEDVGP